MRNKFFSILLSMLLILGGCAAEGENTKIVLTTGFSSSEIFRIEGISCTVDELYVYLTNVQNEYENVYGEQLWEKEVNGVSIEENIKDNVLAKIAQIKSLNLLANKQGITLDEEEKIMAKAAAVEYLQTLNESEKKVLNVTESMLMTMYEEYFLAEKVYNHSISEINLEVSDDEARIVLVQHIVLYTYEVDSNNVKQSYDTMKKAEIYEEAQKILVLAKDQSNYSFESLAMLYSGETEISCTVAKGEYDFAFEEAAFQLETNEISGVVESNIGYHIIKCINPFNKEQTDINKEKMIEQRKQDAFLVVYEEFSSNLTRNLNTKLWDKVAMIHEEEVKTNQFFVIAEKYYTEKMN